MPGQVLPYLKQYEVNVEILQAIKILEHIQTRSTVWDDWIIGNRLVGSLVKHLTIGVGSLGFKSRVGLIGHIVANGSQPPQRFCVAQVLSRGDLISPASRSRFGVI